ncbi:MAG TPA: prephenate dehydrogenase/arogenate dehydrogenase family protein [Anaerolineae bacterium]|nr:prephenate dehydrogenase/arogenate dehydrogenase family protein [Anaerolineae bacterium]
MEPGFKTGLRDCRVAIIGLGLMGGSLALALQGACRSICGYDVDPHTIDQALDRGIIERPIDLHGAEVDLLILAAPVSAILDWLDRVPTVFSGAFHLIDLGSTKTQIIERMHALPDRISPLGGHPMCGKESSGLAVADGNLYRGCLFALTPLARTRPETLNLAQELIGTLHARSLLLDPQAHDRAVAAISHLPYLVATSLMDTVAQLNDDVAWSLAASGFRDTTRLAASDVTMLLDILKTNRAEVLHVLDSAQSSLQETIELLERDDWPELRSKLEAAREKRVWWENVLRKA